MLGRGGTSSPACVPHGAQAPFLEHTEVPQALPSAYTCLLAIMALHRGCRARVLGRVAGGGPQRVRTQA